MGLSASTLAPDVRADDNPSAHPQAGNTRVVSRWHRPQRNCCSRRAEQLVRTRGFAGFSYADLSERVGIQKASIHHHFPTKEALGGVLIDTYLIKFEEALQKIFSIASRGPASGSPAIRSSSSRACGTACCRSAAPCRPRCPSFPKSMQERVRYFFELHLKWLERVVRDGIEAGEVRQDVDVHSTVMLILSTLEGASLVAWATQDTGAIESATKQVFSSLGLATSPPSPTTTMSKVA